jgi:hypothetical protein
MIGTLARQLCAVAGPNQHPTKLPFINYNMPTAGRGKFADSHRQLERPIFPAVECSDRRRLGQDLQDNRDSMNTRCKTSTTSTTLTSPRLGDPLSASGSVPPMTIGDDSLHVCAVVLSDGVLFAAGQFWVNRVGSAQHTHASAPPH